MASRKNSGSGPGLVPAQQAANDVVASNDVNGIEMGVYSDGTTYLTGRALARGSRPREPQ